MHVPTIAARLLAWSLVALLLSTGWAQADRVRDPSSGRLEPYPWLPAGFHLLAGTDPDLPTGDLEPFADLVGDAHFVALGESVHCSGGFYETKHRLIRYLVAELGFRAVTIESPWRAADAVGAWVATGEGTADQAMYGLYDVWQSTEVLALVVWLRSWNVDHPDDPVQFYGFDIWQPQEDGRELRDFVAEVHPEATPLIAGIGHCVGVSAGPWFPVDAEDNEDCLDALDEVETFFTDHQVEIEAATSAGELAWAWIALEGLRAAHGLAWGLTVSDIPFGYDRRDLGMAEVFLRLHALRSEGLRTVLWAHDWHIARNTPAILTDAEWGQASSMGTHLSARLGEDYAPFALAAHTTRFYWPWLQDEPLEHVMDGGIEEHLHHLLRPTLLVDAAAPGLCPPEVRCRRTWPDFATTTNDWAYWLATFDQADQFRGVVFIETSHEMDPMREYVH